MQQDLTQVSDTADGSIKESAALIDKKFLVMMPDEIRITYADVGSDGGPRLQAPTLLY